MEHFDKALDSTGQVATQSLSLLAYCNPMHIPIPTLNLSVNYGHIGDHWDNVQVSVFLSFFSRIVKVSCFNFPAATQQVQGSCFNRSRLLLQQVNALQAQRVNRSSCSARFINSHPTPNQNRDLSRAAPRNCRQSQSDSRTSPHLPGEQDK